MNKRILLIDDDAAMLPLVRFVLEGEGVEVVSALSGAEGLELAREMTPTAIVLDLLLPDMTGGDVLKRLRVDGIVAPVVILTGQGGVEEAVESMKLGACDFVQKPFDRARLLASVNNALRQGQLEARVESLSRELRKTAGFVSIIGNSAAIRRTVGLLERAAESDVTVLLEGESGTGKEVAARAIHSESRRRSAPFIAVNCGAIPEGLIESELFGHEKGAFTGAVGSRPGRFEEADGGTIFLDEIGDLRQDLQVKMLRVLQERQVQRVGSGKSITIDVRIIAATNRDLRAEAAARRFREDLYYRLAVFPVRLPPLREREGDVLLLADSFIRRFADRHGRKVRGLTVDARRLLERHTWPGNVRELENVLERAVILEDSGAISLESLPDEFTRVGSKGATLDGDEGVQIPAGAPVVPFDEIEKRVLLHALEKTDWNIREAAERLAIGRATIYRMMKRHQISRTPNAKDPGEPGG